MFMLITTSTYRTNINHASIKLISRGGNQVEQPPWRRPGTHSPISYRPTSTRAVSDKTRRDRSTNIADRRPQIVISHWFSVKETASIVNPSTFPPDDRLQEEVLFQDFCGENRLTSEEEQGVE
ncbi:uncharacterized protein LOC119767350 [Culex quinquefasciatus]|uniref:uncharacterized protein LOC119767350 n=1 Tax=Culex quinquefasciatus TaxID=7176 RepID=UPI0018E30841|nr:uncharacterized protein LOC119767350 [Culex quinquefasciatus]